MNLKKLNFNFQKEISFYRAIAVISVIFFHSNDYLFSNGYLGVDVFFVVSGFVITKVIVKDLSNNKFSFINFYIRRFKRLYPALIFMIIFSISAYVYFGILNYVDFNEIIKTGLFGVFGLSNIYFLLRDSSYFLDDGGNFLLHLWSLGIEEQYYFIYPAILFLIFKIIQKYNHLLWVFILILIIFITVNFSNINFLDGFYSPLSRFYELIFGCLAFFLSSNKIINNIKYYNPFLSSLLIFLLFTNYLRLPLDLEIFLVSFITFLLLIENPNYINLENKLYYNNINFFICDISYSLYLWHLPIIYFLKINFANEIIIIFLTLIISLFFATFSRYVIEKPLINTKVTFRPNKYFLISPIIFFIVILYKYNVVIKEYYSNDLHKKYEERLKPNYKITKHNLDDYCYTDRENFTLNKYNLKNECTKLARQKFEKIFILYGDCHALHFGPMLNESKYVNNLSFIGL